MTSIQADEHVPQEVITGLNARGIEAYSAYHEGLSGASDRELFRFAQQTNRALLTNDTDFFSLIKDGRHQGIIYRTTQRAPTGQIIRDVVHLIDTSEIEDFENAVFMLPGIYRQDFRLVAGGRNIERQATGQPCAPRHHSGVIR